MNLGPLMPKATAVWLQENTSLTFEQIADFCKMHILEVKGIADGEVAANIKGLNPVLSGQLTQEEISKGERDPQHRLKLSVMNVQLPKKSKQKKARYTPLSKRHDRPNAILWLLKNYPELKDIQIVRLVGTTKNTVEAVRERTHWNSSYLVPMDPVILGLCLQIDLDTEVEKITKKKSDSGHQRNTGFQSSQTLMSAKVSTKNSEEEQSMQDPFAHSSSEEEKE